MHVTGKSSEMIFFAEMPLLQDHRYGLIRDRPLVIPTQPYTLLLLLYSHTALQKINTKAKNKRIIAFNQAQD